MTNYEWVKSLSAEEMARYIINTCGNYGCEECPLTNCKGQCVSDSAFANGDFVALEWLKEEHKEDW